jgi:hypothetical protein
MKKFILIIFLFISISAFGQADCSTLPKSFSSYSNAINQVKQAKFSYKDDISTSNSSWVTSANFYSCDGKIGYLIIGLKNRLYLHQGMPISLWQRFKQASSFGSFYDANVRNRYKLNLKNY